MTRFLMTAAAMMLAFTPAHAQSLSEEQKTEIEGLVKDYILKNPEVLIESFENHRLAQEEKLEQEADDAAKDLIAELDKGGFPTVGAKDADVTIVEFMDYNCGYCKKAFEEISTVLKEDKKVRIYFVEMPILGPTSHEASKWALAADKQGKYFEFHSALMKHQGPKTESVLEDAAEDADLDVEKLKKDKESPEIAQHLEENMERANKLNITGTPGFIIGDEVVRGYLTLDQMKETIEDARQL